MPSPYHPIQLVLGLIIWSVWFVFIYSFLSLSCEYATISLHSGFTWLNATLFLSTIIVVLLLLFLAYHSWRGIKLLPKKRNSNRHIIAWIGFGVYLAAASITFIIGLTVLFLPPCL